MINLYQVIKMDIRENLDIYFELVEDPRSQAHITYKLSDILFMLVTGMLCSCTDLELLIEFAEEKLDFLKEHERPMHIITALLADESVSLGQITVESKSNEIPAVRELIELLDIKGTVLSMDAMHCQKETAELIINNGGDYVLQLKGNQRNFYEEVYAMFDDKYMDTTYICSIYFTMY